MNFENRASKCYLQWKIVTYEKQLIILIWLCYYQFSLHWKGFLYIWSTLYWSQNFFLFWSQRNIWRYFKNTSVFRSEFVCFIWFQIFIYYSFHIFVWFFLQVLFPTTYCSFPFIQNFFPSARVARYFSYNMLCKLQ